MQWSFIFDGWAQDAAAALKLSAAAEGALAVGSPERIKRYLLDELTAWTRAESRPAAAEDPTMHLRVEVDTTAGQERLCIQLERVPPKAAAAARAVTSWAQVPNKLDRLQAKRLQAAVQGLPIPEQLLAMFENDTADIDELLMYSGLPASQVHAAIADLMAKGRICRHCYTLTIVQPTQEAES